MVLSLYIIGLVVNFFVMALWCRVFQNGFLAEVVFEARYPGEGQAAQLIFLTMAWCLWPLTFLVLWCCLLVKLFFWIAIKK